MAGSACIASLHFGIWYYLGIEGTCQAAEEVRSPGRALPLGTMTRHDHPADRRGAHLVHRLRRCCPGNISAGMRNWRRCSTRRRVTGSPVLIVILFVGTLFSAIASANGCINDAARAWFSMGRDRYLPAWFGAVHPRYRTPFRSILFLIPIAAIFALYIPLAQIITFSILSGLLNYTFMPINMWKFRKKWPLGLDPARL